MSVPGGPSGPHILLVDDEGATRALLAGYFETEGYRVTEAGSARAAEEVFERDPPVVVLLDIRMPGKDGLTLTRELRARSEVGIILLTGSRKDEVDRIVGLELGADHYVIKPGNPRELLARVKNLVRRVELSRDGERLGGEEANLAFLGWTLDPGRRHLYAPGGSRVQLTEGEYQLLSALVSSGGRVVTRDQLLERVLDRDWAPGDRTIDVLVGRLRRKLGDSAEQPRFIVTVRGVGYLFAPEVAQAAPSEPATDIDET